MNQSAPPLPAPPQTAEPAGTARLRVLAPLLPFLARHKGRALAALAALTAAAMATLAVPLAIRRMIDLGFGGGSGGGDAGFVNQVFVALVALAAILAVASAARYYLVITLGERIVADLRRAVFAHLLELSPAFFDGARSGEIVSRLTGDTTQIKSAVGASASIALRNLLLFVGATVMMIVTSPRLSALVLLAIPLIVLPLVAFGRRVRGRSRQAQDRLAEASALASEVVSEVRSVQAFTQETRMADRFGASVEEAFEAARSATLARAFLTLFAIFMIFASVVAVLWWGAHSVLSGTMSGGTLGQFVLYSVFAAGALGELSQVWGEISLAAGAAERIVELLETKPLVAPPADPLPLPSPARGAIAFQGVAFGYHGEGPPVLHGIDLDVATGERVAVVGPSGAGKSTLFALLMRFYDPTAGRIVVDGTDIRRLEPAALRSLIALVPQEPSLFALSAEENIRFGRSDADPEAVRAAARAARADGFIAALPQGYDTIIGERGITLSGGERQRVAIARAILKDAPILLLDEATSALDAESETAVQAALETLMEGRTTLVIAHRLATIKSADRIIVVDAGRIVEDGTHAALLARGGLYARLAELQFEAASRPKLKSLA